MHVKTSQVHQVMVHENDLNIQNNVLLYIFNCIIIININCCCYFFSFNSFNIIIYLFFMFFYNTFTI